MGLSDSKTKTASSQQSTATVTPNVPSYISGPASSLYSSAGSLINQTPTTYGPTANQNAAFTGAGALNGSNPTGAPIAATNSLINYNPSQVNPQQIGVDPNDYQASTFNASTVNPSLISGTDLSPYLANLQPSVDATLADWNQGNNLALNSLKAALPNGAFGGSREAVGMGQLLGDNSRTLATTLANMNLQNYQTAQGLAGQDVATKNAAGQFNAGQTQSADSTNSAAINAIRQALASAKLQAAGQNQSADLSAQQSNQNAGLTGANLRLNAANQAGTLGLAGDANTRSNLSLIDSLGGEQRSIQQQNDPMNAKIAQLTQIAQALGINPSSLIGQTTNASGSASGQTTQGESGLDALSQILKIAAAAGKTG